VNTAAAATCEKDGCTNQLLELHAQLRPSPLDYKAGRQSGVRESQKRLQLAAAGRELRPRVDPGCYCLGVTANGGAEACLNLPSRRVQGCRRGVEGT
jgi:hypothetical protein